jgi:hypothetical protein
MSVLSLLTLSLSNPLLTESLTNDTATKRIESFSPSGSSWNDASFVGGLGFSEARSLLGAQGYTFGTGVSTITPDALANVDIFVVNPVDRAFTPAELDLLEAFVSNGGAVLECLNWPRPLFGVFDNYWSGVGSLVLANAPDPAVSAIVAGVTQPVGAGAHSDLSIAGAVPLLLDSDGSGRVAGVVLPPTLGRIGRAVIVGDEEIFMNYFPPEVPGAAYGTNSNNQKLLVNVFGYLSGAPGLTSGAVDRLRITVLESVHETAAAFDLPSGTQMSLDSTLWAAGVSVRMGWTEQAQHQINAFINKVEAQRGKKLTASQADELISMARTAIGSN